MLGGDARRAGTAGMGGGLAAGRGRAGMGWDVVVREERGAVGEEMGPGEGRLRAGYRRPHCAAARDRAACSARDRAARAARTARDWTAPCRPHATALGGSHSTASSIISSVLTFNMPSLRQPNQRLASVTTYLF
jgi:hypothetical protein